MGNKAMNFDFGTKVFKKSNLAKVSNENINYCPPSRWFWERGTTFSMPRKWFWEPETTYCQFSETKHTRKVGIVGKYGVRYSAHLRNRLRDMEKSKHLSKNKFCES